MTVTPTGFEPVSRP